MARKILKFDEFASTEANGEAFFKYLEYIGSVLISPDLNFIELYEVLTGGKLDVNIGTNFAFSFADLPLVPLKAVEVAKDQIVVDPEPLMVIEAELEDDEVKTSGCFCGIFKRFLGNGSKKKFWSKWFGKKEKKEKFVAKETKV